MYEVTKDLTENTKAILDSDFNTKDKGIHIEYTSYFDLSIDGKNVPNYSGVGISDYGSGDLTI